MNSTSFISERSAEYVLVGQLDRILKEHYQYVIPLFPWAKREGSNLSLQLHAGHQFKILSVYARRPKLSVPDDPHISFKFNETIVQGAKEGERHGIPTIAGCPIARNFFELANRKKFVWVDLLDCVSTDVDLYLVTDHKGEIRSEGHPPRVFSDADIVQLIDTKARILDIFEFMEATKEIRAASGGMRFRGPFSYFGGYKPIYFLLA